MLPLNTSYVCSWVTVTSCEPTSRRSGWSGSSVKAHNSAAAPPAMPQARCPRVRRTNAAVAVAVNKAWIDRKRQGNWTICNSVSASQIGRESGVIMRVESSRPTPTKTATRRLRGGAVWPARQAYITPRHCTPGQVRASSPNAASKACGPPIAKGLGPPAVGAME